MGEGTLRPETHALDALIQASLTRVDGEAVATDALLFVGNRHEAFPVWVVQDPILEPVDKVIWMVIKLAARVTGSSAQFPNYSEICRQANIAARSTVARSIAILRLTRWLSLCARVREPCGRFRHNVYALHDEPMPLADALHFDPHYLGFVSDAQTHSHARVRNVARGVSESLAHDKDRQHVGSSVSVVVEHRLAAAATMAGERRRYFAFSGVAVDRLQRFKRQDRNSGMEKPRQQPDGKESNARSCSDLPLSGEKNSQTTMTGRSNFDPPVDDVVGALIFPERFAPAQRALAARHLAAIPTTMRQAILDEAEGRFRAERRGMPVVYDELRFLTALCRAALAGEFEPNLGLKVAAERRAHAAERAARHTPKRDPARDQAARATAQATLTTLRASLGMPGPMSGHTVSTEEVD